MSIKSDFGLFVYFCFCLFRGSLENDLNPMIFLENYLFVKQNERQQAYLVIVLPVFLLLAQKLVYLSMYDRLTITQKWCQNFLDRVHVTESIVMVGDPLKRIFIYWLA